VGKRVFLRGVASNPTFASNNTVAFTLPVDYRPPVQSTQICPAANFLTGVGMANCEVSGTVTLRDGTTTSGTVAVGLQGVSFFVD